MDDLSVLSGLFAYLSGVWANYQAWSVGPVVTAIVEFVGANPEKFPSKFKTFTHWLKKWRHYVSIAACVCAFLAANYLAFQGERTQRIQALRENSIGPLKEELQRLKAHRWEALSVEEQYKLEVILRSWPKQNVAIICVDAPDCDDLAYSFENVFINQLHWDGGKQAPMGGGARNPIELESANPLAQKLIDAVATATNGRIRMAFLEKAKVGSKEVDEELVFALARKP